MLRCVAYHHIAFCRQVGIISRLPPEPTELQTESNPSATLSAALIINIPSHTKMSLHPAIHLTKPLVRPLLNAPLRTFRTTQLHRAEERAAIDPKPELPKSVQHVQPADVVAHARTGPLTEYATEEEIAAETLSGAPSEFKSIPFP